MNELGLYNRMGVNMTNTTLLLVSNNCSMDNNTDQIYWNEKPSQAVENMVTFFSTVGNVFGITSILLNVIFVFAVYFVTDKASAYYHYILNLAMADIFAAIMFLITEHWPHWSFMLIDPQENFFLAHGLGYLFRSMPWLFFTAYLLTLCCLTFNQFVAVCKPWQYSDLVTPRVVKASLITVWGISTLQLLIPVITFSTLLTYKNKHKAYTILFTSSYFEIHIWMGLFAFTILVNIILNAVTYFKIKQLKRRREGESTNMDRITINSKQEAFITLTLLLFASIFCRLPFPIMGIIALNLDSTAGASTIKLIDSLIIFMLHSNFLVDPIIIVSRTSDVRTILITFFSVCRRRYNCCWCCYKQEAHVVRVDEQQNLFSMTTRVNET